MSQVYEPSRRPRTIIRRTHQEILRDLAQTPIPVSELGDAKAGDRCPRPHCGGLVLIRQVITGCGACEELFCANCARTKLVRLEEPYRPMPAERDVRVERLLTPPAAPPRAAQGIDDSMDIGLPPAVLAVVADDTGLHSESGLFAPPDRH